MPCMFRGMNTQRQIKQTLSECTSIEYVRGLLASNEIHLRSRLAEVVCEHFGFYDPCGQMQLSGCLKALRKLEEAGHFVLPEARPITGGNSPRRLSEPVSLPLEVPGRVDDVCGLKLILVTSQEHMRIWNELMPASSNTTAAAESLPSGIWPTTAPSS
jgi:hypothetical protein